MPACITSFIKKTFIDLDYRALINNPMKLTIVATRADKAEIAYFTKADIKQYDYSIPKTSCAIPFVCHPYKVNDIEYFDGALSDLLPVQKALNNNADKIVLILTKPLDIPRNSKKISKLPL